tara:strand:+ start:729 stop:1058 length:330 start_codon:yes stop_codon:yes gene_type:complete
MNLIKRLWNGEIPLVKTYWIYGVIFSNIAALILFSLMTASIESNFFIGYEIARILTLLISVHVIVSIWNSAGKYIKNKKQCNESSFWGYAARFAAIYAGIQIAVVSFII